MTVLTQTEEDSFHVSENVLVSIFFLISTEFRYGSSIFYVLGYDCKHTTTIKSSNEQMTRNAWIPFFYQNTFILLGVSSTSCKTLPNDVWY